MLVRLCEARLDQRQGCQPRYGEIHHPLLHPNGGHTLWTLRHLLRGLRWVNSTSLYGVLLALHSVVENALQCPLPHWAHARVQRELLSICGHLI